MQQFRISSYFRVPLLCTSTKDDRVLLSQLYREFKLSMDVAGASDTVSHQRLIHNLRRRKIPEWITNWVSSFLENRSTTLAIYQNVTKQPAVRTGIPQGSPLSPFLYLSYNADLLDICDRPGTTASSLGFVDDVNIVAYGKGTEENCTTLEITHKKYEKWAMEPYSPHINMSSSIYQGVLNSTCQPPLLLTPK